MAIGKRSTDAIWYVCSFDPALDTNNEAYDWKEYVQTFDRKHIPIQEGFTATEFSIKPLSQKQYEYILGIENGGRRIIETVAFGVRAVRGWRQPDGSLVELPMKFKKSDIGERLNDESRQSFFAPELFLELQEVITRLTTLNPTNG